MTTRRSVLRLLPVPFAGLACGPEPACGPGSTPRPDFTAVDVRTLWRPDPLAAKVERYAGLLVRLANLDADHTRVLKGEGRLAAERFEGRWIDPVVRECQPAELAVFQAMQARGIPAVVVGPWLIVDAFQTGRETPFYEPTQLAVYDIPTFMAKGGAR
jgi:hypothetical protein